MAGKFMIITRKESIPYIRGGSTGAVQLKQLASDYTQQ